MLNNLQYLKNLDKHFSYLNEKLNKENIFLVGGCIRDIILGLNKNPKDIDVTTNGEPNEIFKNIDKKYISIFKTEKFGTITIIPKKQKSTQYELTPFRGEGKYLDFRHPQEITRTNDIVEDSKRRDFTINCIYCFLAKNIGNPNISYKGEEYTEEEVTRNLSENGYFYYEKENVLILQDQNLIKQIFPEGELNKTKLKKLFPNETLKDNLFILIDPFCGISDIFDKKIKSVKDPDDRFQEDALRIIRGVRIVNILNQKLINITDEDKSEIEELQNKVFDFESETWRSMKKNFYLINFLPKERIKDEIIKIFENKNPFGFISIADELNILKYLFPSLILTKNNHQPVRYHSFDTFTHTMLTLYNIQNINKDPLVRLAMLYHDVSKPDQYYYASLVTKEERKQIYGSYIYHPISGAEFVKEDFHKLGFSNKEIEKISFYVKYHMFAGEILQSKKENINKKIKKAMSQFGYETVLNLIDICIADRLGQYNPLQPPSTKALKKLKERTRKIYKEQGQFSQKDLAVNGNDIIKYFNLSPGPKIGEILQNTLNRVLEDPKNRNKKEKIKNYIKENIL